MPRSPKLGKLLGGVNRRDVSAFEKSRSPVSLSITRRANEVFGIPSCSILEPNRIREQDSGEVTSREGPSVNSPPAVAPRSPPQPRAEAPARADTGVNRRSRESHWYQSMNRDTISIIRLIIFSPQGDIL